MAKSTYRMRVFLLNCSQARFSYRVTVSNMEHMVTLQTLIKTPQIKSPAPPLFMLDLLPWLCWCTICFLPYKQPQCLCGWGHSGLLASLNITLNAQMEVRERKGLIKVNHKGVTAFAAQFVNISGKLSLQQDSFEVVKCVLEWVHALGVCAHTRGTSN